MLTEVKINSIDVTAYVIDYTIESTYGYAINVVDITLNKSVGSVLNLDNGQTIVIKRGWVAATDETVFSGYIETFNPSGGKIGVKGKDKLWDTVRKEVTHVYDSSIDASAGKISAIFKDLVETYGGLTASVQDSGTSILLSRFVCNHTDIYERLKALNDVLDWQFYYRADTNKVYFEPKGFTNNATVLTVGSNVYGVPKWNYDITEMINDVTIAGAYQEIETTESGRIDTTAGYLTTDITLSFTPISVKVYIDASNPPTTLRAGGLPDSTGTYYYYVDKNQKKIMPATGTTFTTTNYAEIRYSHAVPIPIHMYNQSSIDSYGQFKKTITYKDLRTVADAEQRGANYLIKYSTPFIYTTLKVKNDSTYDLGVGDIIRVVDNVSTPVVDESMVITKQVIRYPADYDEIQVGDKPWRIADWQASVEERLKRINEDELANQDIIVELLTIDNSINNQITIEPRYFKVLKQTVGGTNLFILGHSSYGILGTSKLGDTDMGAETNNFISQYQNTYTETFIDTDFKDTCTCTWTTTGSATFTNGQTAISKSIDFNNGTITSVKLTSSSSTNLVFSVTANGSTWETTTSGATHTFVATGTDLRWKAVASGNATLTQIKLEAYH